MSTDGEYLTITEPMQGSPAEKGGLKRGDPVIAIDGEDMTGILPELARMKVLGPAGSTVRLTTLRGGETEPFDVDLERASIVVPSVEYEMLDGDIALVELHTFDQSIAIIRNFDSSAVFGPESVDTHKGIVAHMKADLAPDSHDPRLIPARMMIFSRYSDGSKLILKKKPKSESFMFAGLHSFNYRLLAQTGFETMCTLMDAVDCFDLTYSDLDKAMQTIEQLVAHVSGS